MSASRSGHTMPTTSMDRVMRVLRSLDPDDHPNVGTVLYLDGQPPSISDLRDHIADRLATVPALTAWMTPEARRWTVVDQVDLTSHVVECEVPTREDLLTVVENRVRTRLPEDAPHWRMWLLSGYAPDQYAILYLAKHCVHDGAGVLRVLELLFTAGIPEQESGASYQGGAGAARPSLRMRVQCNAMAARSFRNLGTWDLPGCQPAPRVGFSWSRIPADVFTSVARAAGGSRNDVFLASLAETLTRWQTTISGRTELPDIPLLIPTNVRRRDEVAAPGNRLAPAYCRLPAGSLPFEERMASTIRATALLKSPDLRAAMRRNYNNLPTWFVRRTVAHIYDPRRAPVMVTQGSCRQPLAFGDDPVTAMDPVMFSFGGIPLAVAMVIYGDTASASFRTNAGFPGLDQIHQEWKQTMLSWQRHTTTAQ